jgi:hypothetical protein
MTDPMEACLPAMVDNLTTHDYHQIRENLGLTSGSHSVGIRYHMFTHLYEQLCNEVTSLSHHRPSVSVDASGRKQQILELLMTQLLLFRSFISQWRDQHLHLPRNNLGGGGTRSLTGSPDAVKVVAAMSNQARSKDPANEFFPRPSTKMAKPEFRAELSDYLSSEGSLDSALLLATGGVTQSKFMQVQERSGFFAQKSSFSKPPKRQV